MKSGLGHLLHLIPHLDGMPAMEIYGWSVLLFPLHHKQKDGLALIVVLHSLSGFLSFHPYSPQSILGRQGTIYGGQPTDNFMETFPTTQQTLFTTQPNQPPPLQVCIDFNFTTCRRSRCKFTHCCK